MKVLRPLLLGLLLVNATALGACKRAASHEAIPDAGKSSLRIVRVDPSGLERLGIKTGLAGTESSSHTLHVHGSLDYSLEHYAEVGTLLEGRVASLAVKVGDHVKKGQLLATILVPSLAQTQADYVAALAAAHVAKETSERENKLLAKELTTLREAQMATAEAIRAEAARSAARAKLEAVGATVPSGTTITAAGRLPISSPIKGVVMRRDAVIGKYLHPNETAFVIADISVLWATLQVYESDLPYLTLGSNVEVTVDAMPGKAYQGKVALLEPLVGSRTRSVRARVLVPNDDEALRPGLFIQANIALPARTATGLVVAADAVQPLGESDVVFVEHAPGTYEVRVVRVARRTAEIAELSAGLRAGERIVVDGGFVLRGEATKQ